MTPGKRQGLLNLTDSEIQSSVEGCIFQQKIFKFLSGNCVRSSIAEVYSVLLPAAHIDRELSVSPGEGVAMQKQSTFFPLESFASAAGLGDWVPSDF